MKEYKLINGNSATELLQFPDNHFDSVVTDPPYGINFLGKEWDKDTGEEEVYRQCFRVLKPGGHLLAFSAARTYHHLAMAVERSGFEIRDQIMWVYGSGFPKSQDIGRMIDKKAGKKGIKGPLKRGAERMINATDDNGNRDNTDGVWANEVNREPHIMLPESDEAKQWSGWGTQLKPAHEPIVMAQKPFKDSIYKNVQKHGVGAINVDACRVGDEVRTYDLTMVSGQHSVTGGGLNKKSGEVTVQGRFPANFIHDGSDEVVAMFPHSKSGARKPEYKIKGLDTGEQREVFGKDAPSGKYNVQPFTEAAEEGSAARFFYVAKVSKSERGADNNHPTLKPVQLMKYLIKLVTPPGGKVLDPFNGSGSTGMAAVELGYDYTGIELDAKYVDIATKRIEAWWDKTHPQAFANPLFTIDEEEE